MLLTVLAERFSKTAGSHPAHRVARGRENHVAASPIVGRGLAHDLAECAAEGAEAVEAHVEADVGDAPLGSAEQVHGPLHAPALKVAVRRLAERGSECADEVGVGDVGDFGQTGDVEGLRVDPVDRVAGPEHPAVQLLDGEGHEMIFAYAGIAALMALMPQGAALLPLTPTLSPRVPPSCPSPPPSPPRGVGALTLRTDFD